VHVAAAFEKGKLDAASFDLNRQALGDVDEGD
jgi:hypothetical protein